MNITGLGGVMPKKKLTEDQKKLLKIVSNYIGYKNHMPYDMLKSLSNFKTFDKSFNALYNKGYVVRHKTNDYSNRFKLGQ